MALWSVLSYGQMGETGMTLYVAIGDSQTEGLGDEPWPDGTLRGFADRLAGHLATAYGDLDYANLAVSGKQAPEVLAEQVAPAVALRPDIVTLSAGVNDLLRPRKRVADVLAAVDDIIAAMRDTGAQVLLVRSPELARLTVPGRMIDSRVKQFNRGLAAIAAHRGALVPDPGSDSVFEDLRAWSPDRLHLSALGHERLAYGLAVALGVQPDDDQWHLPPVGDPPGRGVRSEIDWAGRHFVPWLGRRVRRMSPGERQGKYLTPIAVSPTP